MSEEIGNVGVNERRVFSRKEAAKYLGLGLATIDRAIAKRDITVCRVGSRVLFQKEHLEEYLNRNVSVARPKRAPRGLLGLE